MAWQKTNPDKKAASDRKQNQKPERKAKSNARKRASYHADPAAANARTVAWNRANPEKAAERSRRWADNNRERMREIQRNHYWNAEGRRERCLDHARLSHAFHKDRAIFGPGGERLDRAYWFAVLDAFEHACCYCGEVTTMTIEHLTPFRKGGRNERGNIACACRSCNTRKKDRTLEEFAPDRAADIRRLADIRIAENDNGPSEQPVAA